MVEVIQVIAVIVCMVIGAFIVTCGLALWAANQEAKEQALEKMADEALGDGNSKIYAGTSAPKRKRNKKGQFVKE